MKKFTNAGQFKKGLTPWNKGLIGTFRHTDEWKIKASQRNMGDKNHEWKGDGVSYSGIHKWVSKYKKKTKCEICGSTTNLEWANKHHASKKANYTSSRKLSDWKCLCHSCHRIYDKQLKIDKKQFEKIIDLYWNKGFCQKELASTFNVSQGTISRVVNKKTNYSHFYPII